MANYKDQWTHCLLPTEPVGLWEGLCFGCFKLFSWEEWGNNASQVPVGSRNRIRLEHLRQCSTTKESIVPTFSPLSVSFNGFLAPSASHVVDKLSVFTLHEIHQWKRVFNVCMQRWCATKSIAYCTKVAVTDWEVSQHKTLQIKNYRYFR